MNKNLELFKAVASGLSVLLSLVAVIVSFRSFSTSKINVLHAIQKLTLEKAKDCNKIYTETMNEHFKRPSAISMEPSRLNDSAIINELMASLAIIKDTLKTFGQYKKYDFFLRQFWAQISKGIVNILEESDDRFGNTSKDILKESMKKAMDSLIEN